jgi:hypothetical protein
VSNQRPRLALAAWAAGLVGVALLADPRAQFAAFLAAIALSTAGWLALVREAERGELSEHFVRSARALSVLARAGFLFLPPAFSADVFRQVYEGRTVWALGPLFAFRHAPAEGPALGVPAALLDGSWSRINHPELPAIYPPLTYAAGALAAGLGELAGGGHLFFLKALLLAADLAATAVLAGALERARRPPAEVLVWCLCPLAVLEVAREGHADSLAVLGLALFAQGFAARRATVGLLGGVLAGLGKLNGLLVLPAAFRARPRPRAWPMVLLLLLGLPYLFGGATSLSAYANRWRANDGAFSLLLLASERVLGGDWARIAGTTLTRHALARAAAAALWLSFLVWLLRRPIPQSDVPRVAGGLLLALLLLSPVLHPWYALWVIPFVPFLGPARHAALALASLAWLGHLPDHLETATGAWDDPAWGRALLHLPVWILVARLVRVPWLTTSAHPAGGSPEGSPEGSE